MSRTAVPLRSPVARTIEAAEDQAIRFLLDGLGVPSLQELHRLVELARAGLDVDGIEAMGGDPLRAATVVAGWNVQVERLRQRRIQVELDPDADDVWTMTLVVDQDELRRLADHLHETVADGDVRLAILATELAQVAAALDAQATT